MPEDYKEDGVGNMDASVFFKDLQQIKLENYMKLLCRKIEILRTRKDRE